MSIDQYYTPAWAAEMLFNRHFSEATRGDVFLDPSAGDGRFLLAIPKEIEAFGVEVDPEAAQEAMANSGRLVIPGDFREVELPKKPTAVIGNPPFRMSLVNEFLARCYECLEYGGKVGFILPVYMFQTANTVMDYKKLWSLSHELIPRNMFQGLSKPVMFATFTKDRKPVLTGFFLYEETASLEGLKKEYRQIFAGNNSRANVWAETLYAALRMLGGKASLSDIYGCIENNRPTANKFWREKIRQVLRAKFIRVSEGVYQLPIQGVA